MIIGSARIDENGNAYNTIMDKALAEAARELYAENLFETFRKCYCEANKEYLEKQILIASEYLTEEQKNELRDKGINV